MQIIEKKLSEIKAYEKNPRKNDAAVQYVLESIKEFGFKVPVVIDSEGVIVAGHTRCKAAKQLGMVTVPCVIANDLTPEQVKAFRLADNKVSEYADWDGELLAEEIDDITNIDMEKLGFNLDDVLDGYKPPMDVTQDEVPSSAEPRAKRGDIYQLGRHRLMCGSSTDEDDVADLMDGKQGKILFTSPPYSDMREYEGDKNLDTDSLSTFIQVYRPYTDYQCLNLGIKRKDNEIVTYWDDYIRRAHEIGYKLLSWNVWDKGSAGSISAEKAFVPIYHEFMFLFGSGACEITHEWMMVFGTEFFDIHRTAKKASNSVKESKRRTYRLPDGRMSDHSSGDTNRPYKQMGSILYARPDNTTHEHPATFPVELPSAYIQAFTDERDIVIEPFGGSGTTIIACEQTGRICYAMELEPKYIDLAIRRWEDFTGERAVLLNG